MSRPIEELLPQKPEARLRIYAWSTKEINKFEGCLKVGQTTQKDVNVRIKQSQGVAQVKYKLEVDESAAAKVQEINGGAKSIPVIVFSDGTHLTEPSDNDLKAKLTALGII